MRQFREVYPRRDVHGIHYAHDRHRLADLEVCAYPAGAEKIATAVLSSSGFFAVVGVIHPLRLVVVCSVFHAHPECAVIRLEDESVFHLHGAAREKLLEPRIGLGRRVEAAPFDVGPEYQPHLIAYIQRPGALARDFEPRGILAGRERKLEDEQRLLAHAAGNGELPSCRPACGIGREFRLAMLVEFSRVALALQPAPGARPQIYAVARHRGAWIRRQNRIVLRPEFSPAHAHLRRRASPVG